MEGPEVVVLDDEEEVIDLTGAADGSLLAELLSAVTRLQLARRSRLRHSRSTR